MNKLGTILAGWLCFATPLMLNAANNTTCSPSGLAIGFFNGIWNTEYDALDSIHEIEEKFDLTTYNNKTINYQLFYNHTSGTLDDILEVFIQRELEALGSEENIRYEIMYELFDGSYKNADSFTQSEIAKLPTSQQEAALERYTSLAEEIQSIFIGNLALTTAKITDNLPTYLTADYQAHRLLLDQLFGDGYDVVLVAHSQGNLFVNVAYDYAMSKTDVDESRVQVVHVAPASQTLRGGYVLANLDLVIQGLNLIGDVPSSNAKIPLSHLIFKDSTGHSFANTYLYKPLVTYSMAQSLMTEALNQLGATNGQTVRLFSMEMYRDDLQSIVEKIDMGIEGSSTVPFSSFYPTNELVTNPNWTQPQMESISNIYCSDSIPPGRYPLVMHAWYSQVGSPLPTAHFNLATTEQSTSFDYTFSWESIDEVKPVYLFDLIINDDYSSYLASPSYTWNEAEGRVEE